MERPANTSDRMRKTKGTRRSLKPYTVLLCPYNHFQVSHCRRLCVPVNGRGLCGRVAPHQLLGKTQRAVIAYNALRAAREKQAKQSA